MSKTKKLIPILALVLFIASFCFATSALGQNNIFQGVYTTNSNDKVTNISGIKFDLKKVASELTFFASAEDEDSCNCSRFGIFGYVTISLAILVFIGILAKVWQEFKED